jgi:hypothetical protein
MVLFRLLLLVALCSMMSLALPLAEVTAQATPEAKANNSAQSTALLVTAVSDPLRVTGSDGKVHLEYDLLITNAFTAPAVLKTLDVTTQDGQTLLQLEGESLMAVTQPMLGRTPTGDVPVSGAVAVVLDVIVPPDQVPVRLTHRLTYEVAPDAPFASIIGSYDIAGPELAVNPFTPVVIASPLRGSGWLNANGCCEPSDHRSFRLVVDGSRMVTPETFAIDWMRIEDGQLATGDGARNEDYAAFGAEVLAVADSTVVAVRDGMAENTPNQPPTTLRQPLDYGGNEVILELAPGIYAFYAHFQPGSIRVQVGDSVTTGQVLGLLGNTGNSSAPHLHFGLLDKPDGLYGDSLPFVIADWTLMGSAGPGDSPNAVEIVGTPAAQQATLPLYLTVADFP